jgi:CTD small phosphatase-like protein 2
MTTERKTERDDFDHEVVFEPQENEAVYPKKKEYNSKKELKEFKKQIANIEFNPLGSRENYPGNYDNYLKISLTHIAELRKINFDYALANKKIYEGAPDYTNKLKPGKKILLIDLDETLIHSDFNMEYINDKSIKYDTVIKFKETQNDYEENYEDYYDMRRKKLKLSLFNEEKEYKVGIFVRRGAKEFLTEVSKHFEIGIFTASVKEYADAVIDFLDPAKNLIKFRLYRNNCINVNDKIFVKNLNIIKGVDIKDIILLDNSIYSFSAQIKNGILVNSFFNDKNDIELYNVLGYLLNFLVKTDDVRVINEQFFNFEKLIDDLSA